MSEFPNSTPVHTGADLLVPAARMPIGGAEGMQALIDDIRQQALALTATGIFPDPGTIGETAVPITESLSGSLYTLSINDATNRYHGVFGGYLVTLDRRTSTAWLEWNDAQYGLYDCPYKRQTGVTYNVSVRYRAYPQVAVAAGGVVRFKKWVHAMGHYAVPDSVTNNGDGTLTFTVTNNAGFGSYSGGGAWASGGKRRVIIWKSTPGIAGNNSVYHGNIESDGSVLTIDVPHTFGQNSPSTTAADYVFLVPGLIISPSGYTLAGDYWHIATVLNGTVDTSAQRLYPLPSDNGFAIRELERRVLHPSKPGCYFGKLSVTRDVADACSISVGSGNVTATLTDPGSVTGVPDDWRIFTAGRICDAFKAGGLTVSMADTADTDTYVVYVEAEEVGGVPQAKLAITDATTFNADYSDRLPLRSFAFDTGTNVVSSELAASLELYRLGGLPGGQEANGLGFHVADLVLYGGRSNLDNAAPKVLVRANSGDLQVLTADGSTDLDVSDVTQRLLTASRESSTEAVLKFYGSGGSGALSGTQVAGLELGKLAAGFGLYQLGGATDADHSLHVAMKSARTTPIVRISQSGGQQTDTIGSARQLVEVPDLKLKGSAGKLVTRGVWAGPHCMAINVNTPGWEFDATYRLWKNTEDGTSNDDMLFVLLPHAGTPGRLEAGVGGASDGAAAKLCRVTANVSVISGDVGDTVEGTIVEVDLTNANPWTDSGSGGGLTVKSSTTTWSTGNDGAKAVEVSGSTDADSVPVGIVMDPEKVYFLRLAEKTDAASGGPGRWVLPIKVTYRVFEFGAGAP